VWTQDAVTDEGEAANQRIGSLVASKLGLEKMEDNGMSYDSHKDIWK